MESKFTLVLVFCLFAGACKQPRKPFYDAKADEAAIRSILGAEQIAWNNGDLEAFMEGFWKSDSLQFMSPRGINHGWQEVLDGYKAGYPDRAAMGTLSYDVLQITQLSQDNFVVAVRFHITREIGGLEGMITLIFKRIGGKWVAVYDHTS
jgi:hypothetical protein